MKPKAPQDLWVKMDAVVKRPLVDDPGVSIAEFAKHYRLSYKGAWIKIQELVDSGQMLMGLRRNRVNGRLEKVYRPA